MDMSHASHGDKSQQAHASKGHAAKTAHNPYLTLALMALLSFLAMFVLMYAMVDRVENALPNLNQAYMAALMAAPMVLIELALMRRMYPDRKWNAVAIGISVGVFALSFLFVRQQTAIGDGQFLRSMIPHHASAILMCEKAPVADAEIQELCQGVISGQQAEIEQMKAILRRIG
jgi:uncharacterized protein (DUF305 family)